MNRYLALGLLLFIALLQFACTSQQYLYPSHDLTEETWQKSVVTNSKGWGIGADKWFYSGEANQSELAAADAPPQAAVSTMRVDVTNFKEIEVNGRFQVQIFGTTEPNSVYIYGPNRGVRATAVEVEGSKLTINQTEPASGDIENTIIRIGIKELNKLTQAGCGKIEARHILSGDLTIITTPSGGGNVYMSGNIKLTHVSHSGSGQLAIFNTSTRHLIVNNDGAGTVNISGSVGVEQINQLGTGGINIVGAYGHALQVLARSGKVSVYGRINVRKITAAGTGRVYIYYVNSDKLEVLASDHATLGLGGKTHQLQLDMSGSSSFYGRHLKATNSIIRTHDLAHANVTGQQEVFAAADGMSSIYYFGNEDQIAGFTKDKGNIIAVGPDGSYAYPAGYVQPTHTVPLFNSKKVIKTR